MQTFSEENYLKIIYNLDKQGLKKITPTAIAEALNNNPASVVDMIKKLSDKKLIQYEKTKGVKLTEKGKNIAISIVRKHRLWEAFLVEKLGYGWDQVHEIAEQLEHVQQAELADRLDKFLGFPQYDPHGDPIPKANGETAVTYKTLLAEITEGKTCQVVAVKDTSPPFLQYLKKLDIGIGTKLTLIEKIPFDNSMVIGIGKSAKTTVSRIFAENLLVHE
ncbi:MAG: metal-dependent transcriptional regulator [Flavipsychrobacter sp.]|jgi:DtxR family Mn-dependent transcriptional regulator|nr:metal-dependent transcriptional regulator [Flavipsychrobacter sp.]